MLMIAQQATTGVWKKISFVYSTFQKYKQQLQNPKQKIEEEKVLNLKYTKLRTCMKEYSKQNCKQNYVTKNQKPKHAMKPKHK